VSDLALAADLLDPPQTGVLAYYDDPAGFARDCLIWPRGRKTGARGAPADYQQECMEALVKHHRVAVRGPRGLGKSAQNAWIILWFSLTRDAAGEDWKAIVTAGAWGQLVNFLWPEVERKWAPRLNWKLIGRQPFSPTELMRRELRLRFGAVSMGAPTDAAKIEGAHADELLYVFDESKSIPDETWDSAEGAFSGAGEDTDQVAYAIASSTPGAPEGRFYDIHTGAAGLEDWHSIHVPVERLLKAKRIGQSWINHRAEQFGRDSAWFQNHVLGEFAVQEQDATIIMEHLEAAHQRWLALGLPAASRQTLSVPVHDSLGPLEVVGVDLARGGADKTVYALRHGSVISALIWRPRESDAMVPAGEVLNILRTPERPARAMVDSNGLGGPVADRIREQKGDAVDFIAQAKTELRMRGGQQGYADCRAAAWWNLREMLEPSSGIELAIPPDDQLTADLLAPHWKTQSDGRIRIESKDDIRARLKRSTDGGDAVVQAYFALRAFPTVQAPRINKRPSRYTALRARPGAAVFG
jgi:hypothetical protein